MSTHIRTNHTMFTFWSILDDDLLGGERERTQKFVVYLIIREKKAKC